MATYVLIHGAGSDSWYWHLVVPELRAHGHDVVAPDLPCDDDSAGLCEYAAVVVDAIGDRTDLVVVAQSLAGFTAPLVCDRIPVRLLILVAAMVPLPGESPGDWWANTGHAHAKREQDELEGRPTAGDFDPITTFLHDVPPDVLAQSETHVRIQSGTPFEKPWPLESWPDVPTRFLLCRDDRFFPAAFMRRVVRERLGITPDEIEGGHLPALSRPKELADRLEAYEI
jgi:pimeloyl-ACP methyl ester carboxylesterase